MTFRTKREAMRKIIFAKEKIVLLITATAVTPRTTMYSSEYSQNLHKDGTSVKWHHYVGADSAAGQMIQETSRGLRVLF